MFISHVNKGGFKGIFKGLVSPFNRPISSCMICRRKPDFYIESRHDVTIEVGDERVPVVGHGHPGDPEAARPLEEGLAALRRGGGLHFVSLKPPRGTVKDT